MLVGLAFSGPPAARPGVGVRLAGLYREYDHAGAEEHRVDEPAGRCAVLQMAAHLGPLPQVGAVQEGFAAAGPGTSRYRTSRLPHSIE
jgi:hypothetical protein